MALLSWARLVNRRSDRVILPWKSSSEYKTNLKRDGLPRAILPHTYTVSTAAVYVELKHPHGLENDDCHRKKNVYCYYLRFQASSGAGGGT